MSSICITTQTDKDARIHIVTLPNTSLNRQIVKKNPSLFSQSSTIMAEVITMILTGGSGTISGVLHSYDKKKKEKKS